MTSCKLSPIFTDQLLNVHNFVCIRFFLLSLPGDVFHNIGKEDHRQQPGPIAPRNSPTGLPSLPPLSSGPALPPGPGSTAQHHYPSIGSQSFLTTATPAPGFMEAHHQGMCLSPAEPPTAAPADGAISAPPSVCRSFPCLSFLFITNLRSD